MSPNPGQEGYWNDLNDSAEYRPHRGDLAQLDGFSPHALVYVVDHRDDAMESVAILLADFSDHRVEMLLNGTQKQREDLVEPLRRSHDGVELTVPDEDLSPYRSVRADGGSKYVNETGDGYLGIIKPTQYSISIPFGMWDGYDWETDDKLWIEDDDRGLAIVEQEPDEPVAKSWVKVVGPSPNVKVPARAVRKLLPISPGEDVRIYRRDDGAMLVVPADPDPLISKDGGSND